MNSIQQALVESLNSDNIIDKHLGKPGLDTDEGRFRVKGILTLGKVFKRKNVGTNLALSAGYLIEDTLTGDEFFVEKQQGVQLCAVYGMKNAFIAYRSRTKKEGEEVLQRKQTVYLQPFPQKTESFTQDDRVRTAFKLDAFGAMIRPFQLNIDEKDCTEELWRIVMAHYEKGSHVSKRAKRVRHEQHLEKISNIRQALKTHGNLMHPGEG